MHLELNMYQTLAIAVLVLILGKFLKKIFKSCILSGTVSPVPYVQNVNRMAFNVNSY